MTEFVFAAKKSDLAEGEMRLLKAGTQPLVLIKLEGEYFAIGWVCSHAFGLLSQGALLGYEVECPIHEGRFDIRTGQPTQEPPDEPIPTYAVRIEGEEVWVGPKGDA